MTEVASDIQSEDEVVGHLVMSPMYGTILEVQESGRQSEEGDNVASWRR